MRQIFDLTSLISLRTLPVTHFNRHLTLAYVPLRKECVENVNLYLNKFAAKNRRKVVFLYWKSGKVGRWWFTLAKSNGFMVFCPDTRQCEMSFLAFVQRHEVWSKAHDKQLWDAPSYLLLDPLLLLPLFAQRR